jgi:nucleotide-binding universal stress UspA family protein
MGVILLLHSGGDDSRDAEEYAFELAVEEKKKLVCLHAIDPIGYYGVLVHQSDKKKAAEHLRKKLEKKAQEMGVECEFLLMEGKPDEAVKKYISKHEEDLDVIILGSTRKKIHQKIFLGSVSEKILKLTKGKFHPTIILKKIH